MNYNILCQYVFVCGIFSCKNCPNCAIFPKTMYNYGIIVESSFTITLCAQGKIGSDFTKGIGYLVVEPLEVEAHIVMGVRLMSLLCY